MDLPELHCDGVFASISSTNGEIELFGKKRKISKLAIL